MASHYVTCIYCGERFNRDKVLTTQVSARRYAHQECAEKYKSEKTQEEKDLEELEKYIMNLFHEPYINVKIKKQIKDYKQQYNYTYSGMLKSLIWFYEIKGNSIEKANQGVGILPYIYNEACQYYYSIYLAKMANEEKDIKKYIPKEKEVVIFSPKAFVRPPKMFIFEEEEEEL